MRGLCHKCYSSNTELILVEDALPICAKCNNDKYKTDIEKARFELSTKKREIDNLIKKHPELKRELSNVS